MNTEFLWKCWPEAEKFLVSQLHFFSRKTDAIASGARLPEVALSPASAREAIGVSVKMENLASCLPVQAFPGTMEGSPLSAYRKACLFRGRKITRDQMEQFSSGGAVGSHLENLQRREGGKGFNQKNVSGIIQRTDPRRSRRR